MPANSLNPAYIANLSAWSRARDVLAGEDAIKLAGERYLPRLSSSSDEEYDNYRKRTSFFNATARTADGYLGLVFRRAPFLTLPAAHNALGRALAAFVNDADMRGTSLPSYARDTVAEIIAVGRAGSLIDWEENERRPYVTAYRAEQIINWHVDRINGRAMLNCVVLQEEQSVLNDAPATDAFEPRTIEQLRVLKLIDADLLTRPNDPPATPASAERELALIVELWRRVPTESNDGGKEEWACLDTGVPWRLRRPLPCIPFVFHGPRHSRADVDKLPLADLIAVNLDHYRLCADYRHGMHYTALPTAWVAGFETKGSPLRVGSSTAWVSRNPTARAGFLEFTGQGLTTFERALDRAERLLAVLGSRLLEPSKKVGETAEAIELRQTGESSVLGNIATSVSESLSQVLRWAYWWHSTEPCPEEIVPGQVSIQLNTDFSVKGMTPQELQAVVSAWQAGALTRETMVDLFRRGEVLPESAVA